jgi:hypothetical protein
MEEKMKQINEEYLFQNKTFILKKENMKHLNISKKDKKFYKKRILNISKKILDDEPQNLNNDIIFAFNSFIKLLIKDFKMIDTNDIYQDDYKDFDNYKNEINDINEINEINDINEINEINEINDIQNNDKNEIKNLNYITNYKNNKNFNLDNFVLIINKEKNKINEEINTIILPKKRIADIKNPLLKNKGLLSKKNEKKEKE